MWRRLNGTRSLQTYSLVVLLAAGGTASAQPKVCGNQTALGAWSLESCPILKDDGVAPDETAGDGIYTVQAQLTPAALLEYKLLPTGMWDGSVEIRQIGTCPADGGPKANDTYNIQVLQPDISKPTLFFYDSRALDASYSPAPGNRSAGDSIMIDAPAGSCPSFVAVGDFQNLPGPNATAAKLALQGRGVLVGRITATKALTSGWKWKVVQQGSGTVREYGPTGWAYAPCSAAYATVSSSVSAGDSVYFLFHAHSGRLQTLVSSSPLDGFSPDGAGSCQPAPDMMTAPLDMSTGDLSLSPGADLNAPSDELGVMSKRPGIHCDCQIGVGGAARQNAARENGLLWLMFSVGILATLRRRLQRNRFTAVNRTCCVGVKGDS